MIFVYKEWDRFCHALATRGVRSIPAREVAEGSAPYLILKHDVETAVPRALRMAEIEAKNGHRGSYYVQAYLLRDEGNVELLKKIAALGHEVSYHHDVMDACRGDLDAAMVEFEKNKSLFEKNGFSCSTVCQHGNPIVERVGYTSNRDFFRSEVVSNRYPDVSDIMVNFAAARDTEYAYYSDAGRSFKRIYDPFFNDVIDSSDRDVRFDSFGSLLGALGARENAIVSTHPHRYTGSGVLYRGKTVVFHAIRRAAKILIRVPLMKKLMSKYYYLAKKL